MTERAKGPASYFPSIEATYGRSIPEWTSLMRGSGLTGHKELVDWLKSEHGMGHGHASALTSHLRAEGTARPTTDEAVNALFTGGKAHWRALYDDLAGLICGLGEVHVLTKRTVVGFATGHQFAMLAPGTPQRFDVGVKLPAVPAGGRLEEAGSWSNMMTHRIRVTDPAEADDELRGWLAQAHRISLG